jgi:hypothetical protein
MRLRSLALSVVAVAMTALSSPMQEMVSAQSGTGIVISEFRFRGPSGGNDEFVELFNAGTAPVDISGWQIRGANNNTPPAVNTRVTINPGTIINPGCFFLAVNTNAGGFSGGVPFNQTYATGIADDGGVALTTTSTAVIIDQVGQGSNAAGFGEGQRLPMVNTNTNRGIERRPGGVQGHIDTNDNFADFTEIIPGTPKNSDVANCLTPGSIGITASVSPTGTNAHGVRHGGSGHDPAEQRHHGRGRPERRRRFGHDAPRRQRRVPGPGRERSPVHHAASAS